MELGMRVGGESADKGMLNSCLRGSLHETVSGSKDFRRPSVCRRSDGPGRTVRAQRGPCPVELGMR
eukprot:15444161-Alexandrium_andersonii.AAC.1